MTSEALGLGSLLDSQCSDLLPAIRHLRHGGDEVDRQRKRNGRILLGPDLHQGLQVTQLNRRPRLLDNCEGRPAKRAGPRSRHASDYLAAIGVPISVPITSPEITSSTRRFCCRPLAVSLDATG